MAQKSFSWKHLPVGLLLLFTCFVASSSAKAACDLRLGWGNWPPYFVSEGGEFKGLEYDFLKMVADDAGCSLTFREIPWARSLKMLEEGDMDMLIAAGYSPERESFAKYSVAYRTEEWALLTRATSSSEKKTISLNDWIETCSAYASGCQLGVYLGTLYGGQIEQILEESSDMVKQKAEYENQRLIRLLVEGEVDGVLMESSVAKVEVKRSGYPVNLARIIEQDPEPMHYIFSQQVPDEIVERFNAAIKRYRDRGCFPE